MEKYGITFAHYGEERELNLNDEEKLLVDNLFALLKDDIDISKLKLTRKSDNYATIEVQGTEYDYDLIRFKYTERARWISIFLNDADREKYIDDPLFAAQKKKTQIHWKSKIDSLDDLHKYKDMLINAYQALT